MTGARAETTRPFDEVKAQIEANLRERKAHERFQTAADQFQNLVYEQADSLAPVAAIAAPTKDRFWAIFKIVFTESAA